MCWGGGEGWLGFIRIVMIRGDGWSSEKKPRSGLGSHTEKLKILKTMGNSTFREGGDHQ